MAYVPPADASMRPGYYTPESRPSSRRRGARRRASMRPGYYTPESVRGWRLGPLDARASMRPGYYTPESCPGATRPRSPSGLQ